MESIPISSVEALWQELDISGRSSFEGRQRIYAWLYKDDGLKKMIDERMGDVKTETTVRSEYPEKPIADWASSLKIDYGPGILYILDRCKKYLSGNYKLGPGEGKRLSIAIEILSTAYASLKMPVITRSWDGK